MEHQLRSTFGIDFIACTTKEEEVTEADKDNEKKNCFFSMNISQASSYMHSRKREQQRILLHDKRHKTLSEANVVARRRQSDSFYIMQQAREIIYEQIFFHLWYH